MTTTIRGLCVALLLACAGCYTTEMVTAEGLKTRVEPAELVLFMKDAREYRFAKGNYRIAGDTISGYGIRKWNQSEDVVLDASCALADCDVIEAKEFDLPRTIALCAGAGAGALLLFHLLWPPHNQDVMVVSSGYAAP
jgi:hypothetical protein